MAAVHQHFRLYCVHEQNSPRFLARASKRSIRRGCVELVRGNYVGRQPLPALRPDIPRTNRVRTTAVR